MLPVRRAEQARITIAVEDAAAGRGSILVIEGRTGYGKTELLTYAQAAAETHGLRVVRVEGPHARQLVDELDDDEVPLALIVDDVHRSEGACIGHLSRLAQTVDDRGLLLVLGLHSSAWRTSPEVARLAIRQRAQVIQLAPLDDDELETIVDDTLGHRSEWLVSLLRPMGFGDPRLVREVVRWIGSERQQRTPFGLPSSTPPAAVSRVLQARLAPLDVDARLTAQALAVLDRDADVRRVAQLTDLSPEVVETSLAELAALDLLGDDPAAPVLEPEIVRLALYQEIVAPVRSGLHRGAASILRADGEPARRIARHLLCAPPVAEEWRVQILDRAAFRAETEGDLEAATRCLRRALHEPAPQHQRLDLTVRLGRLEARLGCDSAPGTLRDALEYAHDPETRSRVLEELGIALAMQGDHWAAADTFDAAISVVEDAADGAMTALAARRRAMAWLEPRIPLRHDGGEDIGADTTPSSPTALVQDAFDALIRGGNVDAVRRRIRRAMDEFRVSDGQELDTITACFAAAALTWVDDLDGSDAVLEQASRRERAGDGTPGSGLLLHRQGLNHLRRGRLTDAVMAERRALDALGEGWDHYELVVRGTLAHAHLERGEFEAATALLDRDRPSAWSTSAMTVQYLYVRAWGSLADGHPTEACTRFDQLGELVESAELDNPAVVPWRSGKAMALHLAPGDLDEAAELASTELAMARRLGAVRPIARASRTLGAITGGSEGIRLVAAADELLADTPLRLDRAWTRATLGKLLRAGGQRSQAREILQAAGAEAASMGAAWLATEIEAELEALGVVELPHRQTDPLTHLTPGEKRVAKLASEGLSNRAIAGRLYISVKAVEFHLSNVYAKLGISSRRQLPELPPLDAGTTDATG